MRNVATSGGALTESNPIPKTKNDYGYGSFTITEYGNSLEWTGKLEDMARLDVNSPFIRGVMDDVRKIENNAVYAQAITTSWKAYLDHATNNTVVITVNGTVGGAALADPQWAGLIRLAGEAEDRLIPYFDGESYVYVTGQQAITKLRLDTSGGIELLKYESGRAALNGELGRIAGMRILKTITRLTKLLELQCLTKGYSSVLTLCKCRLVCLGKSEDKSVIMVVKLALQPTVLWVGRRCLIRLTTRKSILYT